VILSDIVELQSPRAAMLFSTAVHAFSALMILGVNCSQLSTETKMSAYSVSQYSYKSGAPSLGTGKLLLSEMQSLITRKGKVGLDADELTQLQAIHELLEQSVMPGILEGHRESIEELMEFYQAVLDCQSQVSNDLKVIQELQEETETKQKEHEECRKLEDFWYDEKEKVCTEFEEFKENIKEPEIEKMEEFKGQPEDMYTWLQGMSDYFCPLNEIFVEKWEECEEVTRNYTKLYEECTTTQTEYEELFCTLKTRLEEACSTHATCWSEAVQRYEERKAALEELFEKQKAEYVAAKELECLVSSWNQSEAPCIVNETDVEECEENPPDLTNFTIDFPELPDPVVCDVSGVSPHPCEEGWIAEEYLTLGVGVDIIDQTRENCRACADINSGDSEPTLMQSSGKMGHNHAASFAALGTHSKKDHSMKSALGTQSKDHKYKEMYNSHSHGHAKLKHHMGTSH